MKRKILFFAAMVFILAGIRAEISLPAIFSSNMLLQQNATVPIRGKADPNKKVTLVTSWNLKVYSTTSDVDGNWKLSFTTSRAGGPYTIAINDGKSLILSNILLGEVWLCSGQSNMEMPVKGFGSQPVEGSNMDILKSENNHLRLFTIKRNSNINPQVDVVGRWESAMPVSVRDFSATAYYFGRLLQETLKVPVGLIATSWGGSSIEAWMSEEMLKEFPEAVIPTSNENVKNPNRVPTMLYQAMINPVVGLPIKGVIWYQGESNSDRAHSYAKMFKAMVEGWRKNWNMGVDFPFYFCQIAPYNNYKNLNSAFLREAQMIAEKITPNTGMAVLMDIGEKTIIHPAKKKEAGERLSLLALQKTYNLPGFACAAPTFKDIEIKHDTIVVNFENVSPLGLSAAGFESKLFMVAGEDKVFYPATAKINHNRIIVKSESVAKPVAVRYAFENYVVGDLFSTEGLPVSSFRSDDF